MAIIDRAGRVSDQTLWDLAIQTAEIYSRGIQTATSCGTTRVNDSAVHVSA